VCVWQAKLCGPIVTLGTYLSALETGKALYKLIFFTFYRRHFLLLFSPKAEIHLPPHRDTKAD